jgi:YegS/Rv2252/BmrU family lipid kinase
MSKESYVLVMNMKSRQATEVIDEVEKILTNKKCKMKILAVKDPTKLNIHFQKAIDLKPDVIVLAGGDGTLISGIEYLSIKNYKNKIGLLPFGTANYLARNLSIPLTIKESIDILLRGTVREVPIGIANNKYFALTFIIGLSQAAAEHVPDKLKKKFGQIAYVIELFKQSSDHEPFEYSIESPDLKKTLKGLTHQIMVYNSDINQQIKLVPDHKLEKTALKVVINRTGKSKMKFYISFLTHILTFGKIRLYMKVFTAKSLEIATKPSLTADFDGEPYGKSPFKISIGKDKVRVIC